MTFEDRLTALERRVIERFVDRCNADWPLVDDPFDPSAWFSGVVDPETDWAELLKDEPAIPVVATVTAHPRRELQFPREQWVTNPKRRYSALLLADRLLDFWDRLDAEQRTNVALLVGVGGRERIA